MPRSKKKIPYVHYSLIKKYLSYSIKDGPIKTWSRASVIIPEFVGIIFNVHNGKSFVKISVSESMIGHKFGEFVSTRKLPKHSLQKRS